MPRDSSRNAVQGGFSLDEVARRFWWPAYGSLRDDGMNPEASAVLTSRLLARLSNGSPILRHEDFDGRLRPVVKAELAAVRTLAAASAGDLQGSVDPLVDVDWAESRENYGNGIPTGDHFRRRWGTVVLEAGLATLRARAAQAGERNRVERLLPYLAKHVPDWRTTDIGDAIDSADVTRLRDEFRIHVRRAVAETVTTPTSLEGELQDLFG